MANQDSKGVVWDQGRIHAIIGPFPPGGFPCDEDWTFEDQRSYEGERGWAPNFHYDVVLYVLVDPQTQEVRYVGQTTQELPMRLRGHLTDALRDVGREPEHDKDKVAWICSLIAQQKRPLIKAVGYASRREATNIERYIIAALWTAGADLANFADTPRAWCAGSSALTCPYNDRHPVTFTVSHESYIDLRLCGMPFGYEELLESLVDTWLSEREMQRQPPSPAIEETGGDDTHMRVGPVRTTFLDDIPF